VSEAWGSRGPACWWTGAVRIGRRRRRRSGRVVLFEQRWQTGVDTAERLLSGPAMRQTFVIYRRHAAMSACCLLRMCRATRLVVCVGLASAPKCCPSRPFRVRVAS
jgi:hypothetical protein